MRLAGGSALVAIAFGAAWWLTSGHVQAAEAVDDTTSVVRYERAPCMTELPFDFVDGQNAECGYLVVPERHGDPSGRTIKLAVMVLYSGSASPEPDPVVFAQGGPGGSTIDGLSFIAASSPLRENRHLVLFDQRGTGFSEPSLDCPEVEAYGLEVLNLDLDPVEFDRGYVAAGLKCRERLIAEGVDLSAYNTVENAADVEDLRQAFGLESINLYGVSYGTELALNVLRSYPGGMRSVILDGVVPPEVNTTIAPPLTGDEAFSRLFAACEADPDCAQAYPDLEAYVAGLVEHLNEKPIHVRLVDVFSGEGYDALLDGDSLVYVLFQWMYDGNLVRFLPMTLHDLEAGRFSFFEFIQSQFTFEQSMAEGMSFSVDCADESGFKPEDVDYASIRPWMLPAMGSWAVVAPELCREWGVENVGPSLDQPVESDVPVLLTSGYFDPITPSKYAEQVARTLTNSQVVTFPSTGHGAIDTSPCANGIMASFVDDPFAPVDTSCVASTSGMEFVVPGDVHRWNVLGTVLGAIEKRPSTIAFLWVAGVALALVLSVFPARLMVFPAISLTRHLAWRISERRRLAPMVRRWHRRYSRKYPLLARLAPVGVSLMAVDVVLRTVSTSGRPDLGSMGAPLQSFFSVLNDPGLSSLEWALFFVAAFFSVLSVAAGMVGRRWSAARTTLYAGVTVLGLTHIPVTYLAAVAVPILAIAAGVRGRRWLRRLYDRKHPNVRPRMAVRLVPMWATYLAALGPLFLLVILAMAFDYSGLIQTGGISNFLMITVGMPTSLSWILLGGWLLLGIEMLLLAGTIQGLRSRVKPLGAMVYYAVVAAGGVVFVGALAALGLLFQVA